MGITAAVVALVPSVHLLLTSAKGTAVALVQLRPLAEPSSIYDDHGKLLATLQDADYRVPVPLSRVSPNARNAVIDIEDNTFYLHGAIDGRAIARAVVSDVTHGHVVQGGSTITQQLVKNSVLSPARNVNRKLREAVLAYRLEQQMTKNQILERYLNTVYFGNGAYGIEAAALTYFGVHAYEVSPAQAALLAGLISDPSGYDPFAHPTAALDRRRSVLDQMVVNGHLSGLQAYMAMATPLPSHIITLPAPAPNAFVTELKTYLLTDTKDYPALGSTPAQRFNTLFRGGLKIESTFDPVLQFEAQLAVNRQLPQRIRGPFDAALVAIDPNTGYVKALVPGNGNDASGQGFDVATGRGGSGGRNPGSSAKLFTLMAALDKGGYSPDDVVDGTSPCQFGGQYLGTTPPGGIRNAEPGGGLMTIQAATADSVNCAYVRLADNVGLQNVVDMARRLGVKAATIHPYLSTAIGGFSVSPLEMASAYATIANDGVYHHPTFLWRINDEQGNLIYQDDDHGTQVVPSQEARVATSVLGTVVTQGTGTAANIDRPVAGKTGTTDRNEDAWFIGFTPRLTTAVWMGAPASETLSMDDVGGVTVFGGTYPAKIFHDFMQAALADQPSEGFPAFDPSLVPPPGCVVAPDSLAQACGTSPVVGGGSAGSGVIPGSPTLPSTRSPRAERNTPSISTPSVGQSPPAT